MSHSETQVAAMDSPKAIQPFVVTFSFEPARNVEVKSVKSNGKLNWVESSSLLFRKSTRVPPEPEDASTY